MIVNFQTYSTMELQKTIELATTELIRRIDFAKAANKDLTWHQAVELALPNSLETIRKKLVNKIELAVRRIGLKVTEISMTERGLESNMNLSFLRNLITIAQVSKLEWKDLRGPFMKGCGEIFFVQFNKVLSFHGFETILVGQEAEREWTKEKRNLKKLVDTTLAEQKPVKAGQFLSLRLKRLRESKKISQQTLSSILGFHVGAIGKFENNVSPPKEKENKICKFFNVSDDYFRNTQTKPMI